MSVLHGTTMHKKSQIDACLMKLSKLKTQFLGNSLRVGHLNAKAKHSRRKIYDTVDFLWLNIVLTALGKAHIREKRHYLEMLSQTNDGKALRKFHKLIGIEGFSTKLPSIGFFCDYVQYFDPVELESVQNKALRSISFIESEFNLLSIDGKDIRHCNGRNVKSVNVVLNHALRGSYIVDSEQTWIKNKLCEEVHEIFKTDPTRYVFIGDGAYHNTRIRVFFAKTGYLAILPMKQLAKRFRIRLNTLCDMKVNQRQHVEVKEHIKRNGVISHETIRLVPVKNNRYREFNRWTYAVSILTKTTNIKTNLETFNERRFLTNIDLPCIADSAHKLRQLIRQHWQVETFHQYKDINFKEDRYFKARTKAGHKSMVNNFARLVQTLCAVNTKHDIELFKNALLLLVALLIIFLAEQHWRVLSNKFAFC